MAVNRCGGGARVERRETGGCTVNVGRCSEVGKPETNRVSLDAGWTRRSKYSARQTIQVS